MSLLDSSTDRREKLIKLFEKFHLKICILAYLIGIIWFFVLPYQNHVHRTYISENALLPGLVTSDINSNDDLMSYYETIKGLYEKGDDEVMRWAIDEFSRIGIEVYEQNFNISNPIYQMFKKNDESYIAGKNVYAIARAYRAANVESIVISAPLSYDVNENTMANSLGIAQLLTLAKLARSTSYWSKDLIFVIGDTGYFGIQAWLNAYYDMNTDYIQYENLKIRGGAIQAALNLEVNDPRANKYLVKLEGANGQLPNLDLFNTVVRICQNNNFLCGLDNISENYLGQLDLYKNSFENMVKMMLRQATGVPTALHGYFLRHHIEAITLQGVMTKKNAKQNTLRMIRIVEGTLRSINNLLERFHQSFFFYLLPTEKVYVSIGMYMPTLGCIILPLLVQILHLWLQFFQTPIENINNSIKIDLLRFVVPDLLVSIIFGLISYGGSSLFMRSGLQFGLEPKYSLLAIQFAILMNTIMAPFFIYHKMKFDVVNTENTAQKQYETQIKLLSFKIRKFFATIFLALFISSLSLINFSLAFLIAIFYVPLSLLVTQIDNNRLLKFIQSIYITIMCPFLYFTLIYFAYSYYIQNLNFDFWLTFEGLIDNFYYLFLLSKISNIWTYDLICLSLYPIWSLFWFMSVKHN